MIFRTYIRLARNASSPNGFKVEASASPNASPITVGSGAYARQLPTLHFAVEFDVPPEAFNPVKWESVGIKIDPRQTLGLEVEQVEEDLPE